MKQGKPLRSLRSKALQLLSQREQSRLELRRKLMAHALAEEAASAATATAATATTPAGDSAFAASDSFRAAMPTPQDRRPNGLAGRDSEGVEAEGVPKDSPTTEAPTTPAARVDEVLAWLDAHRFQSDDRFMESRVNARAARYGDLRIRQELKQHGVPLDADTARALGESETSRAWAVWLRRFGGNAAMTPLTASDAARQSRFLTARGFSPDAVRQVLRQARAKRAEAPPSREE